MARLFSDEYDSDKIRKDDSQLDFKKLLFVAFEGVVTEPEYFNSLNQFLKDSKKYSVKIYPVERLKTDGKSHPLHVRDGMVEFFHEKIRNEFDRKRDELWIVIDIDEHFKSTQEETVEEVYKNFLSSLIINRGIKINAAISNPSFEIWQILHFLNAEELDFQKVKENERLSRKYTYVKKLLADTLRDRNLDKDVTIYYSRTKEAIVNTLSERICTVNDDMINNVGTTVGKLLSTIFEESV